MVTLNDLERRNDRYFALFFSEIGTCKGQLGNYVTVVEVKPILSATKM